MLLSVRSAVTPPSAATAAPLPVAELPGARVLWGVVCVYVPSFGVDTYRLTNTTSVALSCVFLCVSFCTTTRPIWDSNTARSRLAREPEAGVVSKRAGHAACHMQMRRATVGFAHVGTGRFRCQGGACPMPAPHSSTGCRPMRGCTWVLRPERPDGPGSANSLSRSVISCRWIAHVQGRWTEASNEAALPLVRGRRCPACAWGCRARSVFCVVCTPTACCQATAPLTHRDAPGTRQKRHTTPRPRRRQPAGVPPFTHRRSASRTRQVRGGPTAQPPLSARHGQPRCPSTAQTRGMRRCPLA